MIIKLSLLNNALWFVSIVLLAFSFPFQVLWASPYPSLMPYLCIALIILLNAGIKRKPSLGVLYFDTRSKTSFVILVYVFFVFVSSIFLAMFNLISGYESISAIVIYFLPVVFYWYFRSYASEKEIQWTLMAIAISGIFMGLYFSYDSYLKLVFGEVSEYAVKSFQYSIQRSGQSEQNANIARITTGSRSFGLLETHTVSGAWCVMSMFAFLALINPAKVMLRQVVIVFFGVVILLTLNFTAIILYIILNIVFVYHRCSNKKYTRLFSISLFLILMAIAGATLILLQDNNMSEYMASNLSFQIELLFGTGENNLSMSGIFIDTLNEYLKHMLDSPFILMFGNGFSSFGFAKGGDIGFFESLATLGLPLFILITFGFFVLIRAGFKNIKNYRCAQSIFNGCCIIQFSIAILLLVLITDGHYSVWGKKSILPIVFFAIALLERYAILIPQNNILK